MSSDYLSHYTPLLIHLLLAMALSGVIVSLSSLVGWRRPSRAKMQAYECGILPTGDAREPISVKFYMVAMIFILFDAETMFLVPWAYVFKALSWPGFYAMAVFVGVLALGDIYLWKKGAFDWSK
jgi:NADH-quinone oxidoreductase subunit A